MALLLNGVSTAQADRALDPIVPVMDGVAGVVYCTPATLEQVLEQSGWPAVAFLDSDAMAAPLVRRGVRVLSARQALPMLGEWSTEAVQEVAS